MEVKLRDFQRYFHRYRGEGCVVVGVKGVVVGEWIPMEGGKRGVVEGGGGGEVGKRGARWGECIKCGGGARRVVQTTNEVGEVDDFPVCERCIKAYKLSTNGCI